jgi:hypothetical protein
MALDCRGAKPASDFDVVFGQEAFSVFRRRMNPNGFRVTMLR